MSELKTEELELTTGDLASHGIAQKQPNEPNLVKAHTRETLNEAVTVSETIPLFTESETEDFRSQWTNLQTGFVDEPRRAVENADKLVAAWKSSGTAATTCPQRTCGLPYSATVPFLADC